MSLIIRKRLSCSELSYMEIDSSPPLGARRRFSALMDTHRLCSPLEGDSEQQPRQHPVKTRGKSFEGVVVPSTAQAEQSVPLKEDVGGAVGGESSGEEEEREKQNQIVAV